MLLAIATAQNGYEYNKPGKPFGPGSSSSHLGTGPSSSYPTTTSFAVRPQTDEYGSSTPRYSPGSSNYRTGEGYPGFTSQRPQPGYPGSSYPGQGSSSNYPGNTQSGNFPGQGPFFSGQSLGRPSGNFIGQGSPSGFPSSRYPLQPGTTGFRPGYGSDDTGAYYNGDYSAIPGQPDIDYPILSDIPHTSFSCNNQAYPGYYSDVETRCQVFHVCANNKTYDFICPNGTIFSQEVFVCVWWNEFDCHSAPGLYGLNANLYDYSIVGSPGSFSSPGINGPQGPGRRPQGLFNKYPSNSGPESNFVGSSSPVVPVSGYSGTTRPETTSHYPGSTGFRGPLTGYSTSSRPQGPLNSYPGSSGPHSPATSHQGSSGPLGPASNYPGSSESYDPSIRHPGSTGIQGPSTSYPKNGSPGGYPGTSTYPSTGPHGPSTSYPGITGSRGPSSYPGSSRPSYPGTGPNGSYPGPSNYSGNNQGYPSGKPSGLGFPTGSGGRPHQPNREYLPPRN